MEKFGIWVWLVMLVCWVGVGSLRHNISPHGDPSLQRSLQPDIIKTDTRFFFDKKERKVSSE